MQWSLQCPPPDPEQGLQHQRDDGGPESEQQARGRRQVAEPCIQVRQPEEQHDRRNDEAEAGNQPAAHAVQPPAEVDRELQRLGAGQQHAEIESVGESSLVDPAALIDELAVHDGDLARRSAERDEAEAQPEARRVAERGSGPQNISEAPGSLASAFPRAAMKSPVTISS